MRKLRIIIGLLLAFMLLAVGYAAGGGGPWGVLGRAVEEQGQIRATLNQQLLPLAQQVEQGTMKPFDFRRRYSKLSQDPQAQLRALGKKIDAEIAKMPAIERRRWEERQYPPLLEQYFNLDIAQFGGDEEKYVEERERLRKQVDKEYPGFREASLQHRINELTRFDPVLGRVAGAMLQARETTHDYFQVPREVREMIAQTNPSFRKLLALWEDARYKDPPLARRIEGSEDWRLASEVIREMRLRMVRDRPDLADVLLTWYSDVSSVQGNDMQELLHAMLRQRLGIAPPARPTRTPPVYGAPPRYEGSPYGAPPRFEGSPYGAPPAYPR